MARRFNKDESGELETAAQKLIDTDFPLLEDVRINYVWVDGDPEEQHGRMLEGRCRKLPARDRDLFGYDVVIQIAHDLWQRKPERERMKLLWHELNHIVVEEDVKKGDLKRDGEGRIKIGLRLHDLNLERFEEELRQFGTTEDERAFIEKLRIFPASGTPAPSTESPRKTSEATHAA